MARNIKVIRSGIDWWNSLSINEKVYFKNAFEVYRNKSEVIKNNYPDMYDLRHLRISQLTTKHIERIWVFKDFF
jgi:hypothetical protein